MTLRELLSHFTNKMTWVILNTSSYFRQGKIREIERDTSDDILDSNVKSWNYTDSLNIEI